jgi:hypothetical protein
MMMAEIMRKTQNPRHVATAHLGRRFTYLAIECSCFFDDQDTRFGTLALQYERSRRSGKRATDDHDVVIEIHRSSQIERSTIETQSVSVHLFICHQSKRREDACASQKLHEMKRLTRNVSHAVLWSAMRLRIASQNSGCCTSSHH